jgi:hypothetical protein
MVGTGGKPKAPRLHIGTARNSQVAVISGQFKTKRVSRQMHTEIDRLDAERHRADLEELDRITELFMHSQMATAHFSADHHYLGSEPASCRACQLRDLLVELRKQWE